MLNDSIVKSVFLRNINVVSRCRNIKLQSLEFNGKSHLISSLRCSKLFSYYCFINDNKLYFMCSSFNTNSAWWIKGWL